MYRVLLADDEPIILSGLKSMLDWERLDCVVCGAARDGQQALELVETLRPDIVVCDIRMPRLTGLELLEACVQRYPQLVFIMLTNHQDFHMAQQSLRNRAADYLLKIDLDEEKLARSLRLAIDECEKRRRLCAPSLTRQKGALAETAARHAAALLSLEDRYGAERSIAALEELGAGSRCAAALLILDPSAIPDIGSFTPEERQRLFSFHLNLALDVAQKVFLGIGFALLPSLFLLFPYEEEAPVRTSPLPSICGFYSEMLIPSLEILKDTPLRSFFHLSIILNVRAVPRLRRENHDWRLLKSWKQKVLIHMKPLTIRNITLGEGRPKIIVPIVDRDAQAILDRAAGFVGYQIDLVEWRADFFDRVGDAQAVEQVLKGLRERLPDKLLLFTFRTGQEGGARDISPEDYLELNRHVAESGRADLIDVEIFRENAAENIRVIHAAGARVVGSNHAFHNTPPHSEILYRLRKAQDMGADIPKIAVMARSPRDVLTLLAATEEMYTDYADRPLLTMSMGGTGTVSRLAGEIFGSCATFGTIGESSAPGQIPADELAQVLDVIHRSNG